MTTSRRPRKCDISLDKEDVEFILALASYRRNRKPANEEVIMSNNPEYEELLENATKEINKFYAQANTTIRALGKIDLVYQEQCITIRESIAEMNDDFNETTRKIDELENKGSQDWDEWSSVWKDQRCKTATERGISNE